MIRTGDTIYNPVTGERITFHATSADTNGESVVIECRRSCSPTSAASPAPKRRRRPQPEG